MTDQVLTEMNEKNILNLLQDKMTALDTIKLVERKAYMEEKGFSTLLGYCYENGIVLQKSDENAVYWYQKGVREGNRDALYALSVLMKNGRGIQKDDILSRDYMARAAHLNHSKAEFEYAVLMLESGHDTEAVAYFEKALKDGIVAAATYLGEIYEQGVSVPTDLNKAISYYEQSYQTDLKAAYRLALLKKDDSILKTCIDGEYSDALYYEGMRKNDISLLERALNIGVEKAKLPLARLYFNEKNYEKAIPLLKTLNEGEAFCLLGYLYRWGVLPKSHKQAALSFQTSYELNYPLGIYELARCYDTGYGMIRNEEKAMEFYPLAAKLGQVDSIYEIGRHKLDGLGTAKDEVGALEEFRIAADMGHAKSAYTFAKLCADETKSRQYVEKSANGGYPEAMYDLGMYLWEKSPEKAAKWFEIAHEKGHIFAGIALADSYRLGKGKQKDERKAFDLYEKLFTSIPPKSAFSLSHWVKGLEFAPEKKWIDYLALGANGGHADAQYVYAVCFVDGKDILHDLDQAIHYLDLASNQGHLLAKEKLAEILSHHETTGIDEKKAHLLYSELYQKGVKKVGYPLGIIYKNAYGTDQDLTRAAECFLSAAGVGIEQAQVEIAECFAKGLGIDQDKQKAWDWFTASARQGNPQSAYEAYLLKPTVSEPYFNQAVEAKIPDALCKKGLMTEGEVSTNYLKESATLGSVEGMYQYGNRLLSLNKDELAVEWLQKATEQGSSEAELLLADCYLNGIGIIIDQKKACFHRENQAFKNVPKAQLLAGDHYRFGYGVDVNYARAYDWYLKAAEQGIGEAQYKVSLCYLDGIGTQKNLELASAWLKKAFFSLYHTDRFAEIIEKGVKEEDGSSLLQIGKEFYLGTAIEKDYAKSEFWYRKSANLGYAEGYYLRGRLFTFGEGVQKDDKEALWNYTNGANLGDINAMYETAISYYDGRGTLSDNQVAISWFKKFNEENAKRLKPSFDRRYAITQSQDFLFENAVEGNAESKYVLASRFRVGFGMEQNEERTQYWMVKANSAGNEDASKYLSENVNA